MIQIAKHHQIIDVPNTRSSHSKPTPRGGGMGIAVTWFIALIICYYLGYLEQELFLALFSGIILVVVGFIDDVKNLSSKIRLISQVITAMLGLYFLGGLQVVSLGLFSFHLIWILNTVVILAIIWIINLFNFLDGLDGYLACETIFLFIAFFLFTSDFFALVFAACVLGFLFWNWPKAKIFSGDVGSTLIGYTFIVFSIHYHNSNKLTLIVPIIISVIFWFDASITLLRRWKNKERLITAHKKHAYQRMHQAGIRIPVILFIVLCFNSVLLLIAFISDKYSDFLLLGLIISILIGYLYVKFADLKKPFNDD